MPPWPNCALLAHSGCCGVRMDEKLSPEAVEATRRAMELVRKALDMLDATSAPPHVTAHLELALAAMRAMLPN